jgi:hypothetical protein
MRPIGSVICLLLKSEPGRSGDSIPDDDLPDARDRLWARLRAGAFHDDDISQNLI